VTSDAALVVEGLKKAFGAVHALGGVSFQAQPGTVHAILGENGAGKSTLVRSLVGLIPPDSGEISLGAHDMPPPGRRSVSAAFQESSLLLNMTVAQNLFFAHRSSWWRLHSTRALRRQARKALNAVAAPAVREDALVGDLTVAQRQIVEVAKALISDPQVLILDEANSALSGEYNAWFLDQARTAAKHGRIVLLITHRLAEVRAVADSITVLRGGVSVLDTTPRHSTNAELIEAMIGHRLRESTRSRATLSDKPVMLKASALRPKGALDLVNIDIQRGEIVGLAGLDGQGQSEVIRALAGALPWTGEVTLDGAPYRARSPRRAVAQGVGLVPPDRQSQGLLTDWSIAHNISLSSLSLVTSRLGLIDRQRELSAVHSVSTRMNLPGARLNSPVSNLSGGNQQRVVLARVLLAAPKLLLLFDGTRGVDVATRESILDVLAQLAADGMSILFYSSDLSEYAQIAHRVEVMSSGRIVGSVQGASISEESILRIAVEAQRENQLMGPSREAT